MYCGVAACHRDGVCVVVWQHVIDMVCILWCGSMSYVLCVCCGVTECHSYGVCTVVWQHVIVMLCVLWCGSMS